MNLKQIESGMDGNVGRALRQTYRSPTSFLSMFSDVTEAKQEASRHNQGQMDYIQQQVKQTRGRLEYKMDELWDIYNSRVVKFENTDDAYKDKAGALKSTYTNFFEGLCDDVENVAQGIGDLISGVYHTLEAVVVGVLSVSGDVGAVVSSGMIPDPIEPAWLHQKADATVDGYADSLKQIVKDPMGVMESLGQSVSDTVDEKGIAYATGAALPSLIPATWALKGVRGVSGLGRTSSASRLKNAIPYSKDYLQRKVDLVKTEMKSSLKRFGDKKLIPAPYIRQLSTGYRNMPVMGMDWKTLSDAKAQMFAMKGTNEVSQKKTSTENGITKNEYKNLRKKTPSNKIRKTVNPNGPKVDPVYGYEIDKFEADHIVSMKEITEMDGFGRLTKEQQIEILNFEENFVGLGKSTNASKVAHSWADWRGHSKMGNVPDNVRMQMLELEERAREALKKAIDERLK